MALSQATLDALNKGNGGGGRQAALPDGTRVPVTIAPSKKDIGYIEREPHAKSGPNAQITAMRMRFVVPAGHQYANRNFFANVPTSLEQFGRDGSIVPSYQSIGLIKALGYEVEDIDEDTLAKLTDRELLNKPLELVLGVEDDPRFDRTNADEVAKEAQNPLYAKRNFVRFINRPSSTAPTAAPA
ncbi:hypothetical protein, partial [Pseudolysinimonas sp.]|uniref:hypothetical protein n=1 Tax=Pseudolysinimonas sp. TaxID=2680009 RepID=UPI003F7E4853